MIASYDTYDKAQRAVDALLAAEFDVRHVTIVGRGLESVERLTGVATYGRAAVAGAVQGSLLGAMFALLMSMFAGGDKLAASTLFAGLLIGAGLGVLAGIAQQAIVKRAKKYTSQMALIATAFDVVIDDETAGRARSILQNAGVTTGQPIPAPGDVSTPQPPAKLPPQQAEGTGNPATRAASSPTALSDARSQGTPSRRPEATE